MSRWLVFDTPTADAAQHSGRHVELQSEGNVAEAINDAVQEQRTVVLVLPAGDEQVTVARVTPPETRPR